MIGGVEMRGGLVAATAAVLLLSAGATPSFAADFGGNCCADLEERIAELEATTARKGNRKVSLTVYGQVNQGVLYWDDGFEDNVYAVTNDNARTRIGFRGNAKITGDWSAGYRLEIGVRSANSKRFTQDDPLGATGLDLRDSHWYIDNKNLGRVTVGLGATATDQITEINQTQTADFSKFSDVEDTGLGLLLRRTNGDLAVGAGAGNGSSYTYHRLIGVHGDQPGEGERRFNGVTYRTPEFAGFTASATWAEDDYWDVALRYAGEFAGLKVAAGIGYGEIKTGTYQNQTAAPSAVGGRYDADQFGGSISVVHVSTGLFVNFGAGTKTDNAIDDTALFSGAIAPDNKEDFWALQVGIERKWTPFGLTTIYGEYYNYDGGSHQVRTLDRDFAQTVNQAAVLSTGLESWGLGVAQGFDAAALTLYLSYRHVKADLTVADTTVGGVATGPAIGIPLEDLDLVFAGGVIKF